MATWTERRHRPGDVVRYYDGQGASAVHRAGRYIRTITRGPDRGSLEVQATRGRHVRVHPSRLITPKEEHTS